jgi:hypothetical protein
MPPLKVEYAKSGRSLCSLKECSKAIEKGAVRVGTGAMMPGADELRYKWRHLCCFTKRQLASVQSVDAIQGYEDLAASDQALVRRMVKGELIGNASVMGPSDAAPAAVASGSPKKKNRAEAGASPSPAVASGSDDDAENGGVTSVAAATAAAAAAPLPIGPDGRRICPYGELCFRIDPAHFGQCSHALPPAAPPRY